jgi:hypothetical protein
MIPLLGEGAYAQLIYRFHIIQIDKEHKALYSNHRVM